MASCKDCLIADICYKYKDMRDGKKTYSEYFGEDTYCEHFKERSRFVELPCKVGDTIYEIKERKRNGEWHKVIVERVVNGIEIGRGGFMTFRSGATVIMFLSDLGKTVFLTREESEKALKERENNG